MGQFTEMVKNKDGRCGALLNLNLDQKETAFNKRSINLEIKGVVIARESLT